MASTFEKWRREAVPLLWLCTIGLILVLFMTFGMILLIVIKGAGAFWQKPIWEIHLKSGEVLYGEIREKEKIKRNDHTLTRYLIYHGARDIYGVSYRWIDEKDINSLQLQPDSVRIERKAWGPVYGKILSVQKGETTVLASVDLTSKRFEEFMKGFRKLQESLKTFDDELTKLNEKIGLLQKDIKKQKYHGNFKKVRILENKKNEIQKAYNILVDMKRETRIQVEQYKFLVQLGREKTLVVPIDNVLSIISPQHMNTWDKTRLYLKRWWALMTENPREANTEGGIYPAIFGTVAMVLIMTIFVVPLGVIAAVYLQQYAGHNIWTRLLRISISNLAGVPSIVFGVFGMGFFIYRVGTWIDRTLYPEFLPDPTYGTGGLLWASLTLALLTLPVVIVSTEEALLTIPKDVEHGARALGATKWQTIRHIILPNALPGILTGTILAIARAAGEVAPLMLTGVVKLAPYLPIDTTPPFVHLERKFMHLGFHIYDVGFQSPDVESAKPLVYNTTLLLLLLVIILNSIAIYVRNRVRKRYGR